MSRSLKKGPFADASLLKKAQEFDEKLKDVKGDMTTAQLNKFLEIQKKMLSAMQEDTNN